MFIIDISNYAVSLRATIFKTKITSTIADRKVLSHNSLILLSKLCLFLYQFFNSSLMLVDRIKQAFRSLLIREEFVDQELGLTYALNIIKDTVLSFTI
jgi:hypothetical protein